MRIAAVACILVSLALPAAAQTRTPAQRQVVLSLARTLGEAHALRLVCHGDYIWYGRMESLIAAEKPDAAYESALKDAFNSGFHARQAQFPTCTRDAEQAQTQVDAKGSTLSRRLAKPEG